MSSHVPTSAASRVYLALADRDWDTAVEVAEREWDALLAEHPAVLRAVAATVPEELLRGRGRGRWLDVSRHGLLRVPVATCGEDDARWGRIVALTDRAVAARRAGDIAAAVETASEARDGFRRSLDAGPVPRVLPRLAFEWAMTAVVSGPMPRTGWEGDPDGLLEEAYSWAMALQDHATAARAAAELAWLHAFAGRAGATERWMRRAAIMRRVEQGLAAGASPARLALSMRRSDALDFAGAIEALAPLTGEHLPDHGVLVATAAVMYAVHLHASVVRETRSDLQRAAESTPAGLRDAPLNRGALGYAESYRLLLEGRPEAALALMTSAPGQRLPLYAEARRASALLQRGDLRGAELSALAALDEGSALPRFAVEAAAALAAVQLRTGRRDAARASFGRAVDLADRHRLPVALGLTSSADHLRLVGLVERSAASPSLRALRDRPMLRPETIEGFASVTAQERRVIEAIADGLSVVEVAARLDVSVNTVKTQLRAVYGKLGVSRRAHMLRAAREQGLL